MEAPSRRRFALRTVALAGLLAALSAATAGAATTIRTLSGDSVGDIFGLFVANVGDIDGDGSD
ncbi:MAG: hypothetical protein K8I02_09945, partial [Candidatus Methylomirabilis sp.]|nr:hypothetical protein [Deltaproteobacteria bacterium]